MDAAVNELVIPSPSSSYLIAKRFNVTRGEDISIQEITMIVKEFFNSPSEIRNLTPPASRYDFEVERRFGDSDKLEKTVGYRPRPDLREGFTKTYEELRDQSPAGATV